MDTIYSKYTDAYQTQNRHARSLQGVFIYKNFNFAAYKIWQWKPVFRNWEKDSLAVVNRLSISNKSVFIREQVLGNSGPGFTSCDH